VKTSAAIRTGPTFDAAGFMNLNIVISGHLRVGSALPDPPFEFMDGDNARGFDVERMHA
jgi:ABC-type amino acid transport substrate-binding protein